MKRRAFTVIELLVVISVISVLAAILFPVFSASKESAKGSVCLQQIRQIGIAQSLYRSDFDDRMPYAVSAGTKFTAMVTAPDERGPLFEAAVELPTVDQVLASYQTSRMLWRCPLDHVESLFLQENVTLPPYLQWKATYYETYGSSYNYDDITAVLGPGQDSLPSAEQILFCDYAAVHGPATASNGGDRNLVFADSHAALDTHNLWSKDFAPQSRNGEWY